MQEIPNNIEAEAPLEIRKKNMLAMAVALGADETTARENIEEMFQMEQQLGRIQYNKSLREFDGGTLATIRRIGSRFLSEKSDTGDYSNGDNREFAVGIRALKLMREPLGSVAFNELRADVKALSFGQGADRFDEVMESDF